MTADLEAAATAAGLVDMDLLRIAREGLSPADAVRDLRSRYPGAFRSVDVRGMDRAQFTKARKDLMAQSAASEDDRRRAHIDAELAKPSVRNLSKAEADRRLAEYLRGLY